jgi:hypothetical protein
MSSQGFVAGRLCFGEVYVGQHSELLWPHDLTDWIGASYGPCLVHWCSGVPGDPMGAHTRVSPGDERCGRGYVVG